VVAQVPAKNRRKKAKSIVTCLGGKRGEEAAVNSLINGMLGVKGSIACTSWRKGGEGFNHRDSRRTLVRPTRGKWFVY